MRQVLIAALAAGTLFALGPSTAFACDDEDIEEVGDPGDTEEPDEPDEALEALVQDRVLELAAQIEERIDALDEQLAADDGDDDGDDDDDDDEQEDS